MDWFVEKFVNVLVNATSYIADVFGNSILGLLTMDIGSGTSFFDIVFSSVGDFYQYFIVIAIAFLMINYVWQLGKMMFLAQGSNDTPLGLTAWTIIAGILIYSGRFIIYTFEGFFNTMYGALLSVKLTSEATAIDFTGVSEKMTSSLNESAAGSHVAAAGSVGGTILSLLLLFMLVYQFIMFLIEIAERYIVLGVLYYTCPLAFSVLGSRSTSNIFSAWVRMVGSQLFLMLCNVIFFRIFMMGLNSYDTLIETYKAQVAAKQGSLASYQLGTIIIVWCLMMHGILAVATRIDSYLNTLGLSAAQTGRGLAGAMVASAMGVRRTFASAKNGVIGTKNAAKWIGGKSKALAQRRLEKKAQKRVHQGTDGIPTAGSYGNAMDKSLKNKERAKLDGFKGGEGFIKNSSLNNSDIANGIDKNSFKTNKDGTFSFMWTDPNTGKTAEVTAASLDPDKKGHTNADPNTTQGRVITMTDANGKEMKMFASATGAGASAFNSKNDAMTRKMEAFNKQENCSAKEVAPGVWQTMRTDNNGNIIEAKEYACDQMYNGDSSLNSSMEQIGGMDYHVTDLTNTLNNPAVARYNDNPASTFDDLKAMGDISNCKSTADGRFAVSINGQQYTAVASAMWNVSPDAKNVQTMHSKNGSEYKLMPKAEADAHAPTRRNVKLGSNNKVRGTFATPKMRASQTQSQPKPKLYQAAMNRLNPKKK